MQSVYPFHLFPAWRLSPPVFARSRRRTAPKQQGSATRPCFSLTSAGVIPSSTSALYPAQPCGASPRGRSAAACQFGAPCPMECPGRPQRTAGQGTRGPDRCQQRLRGARACDAFRPVGAGRALAIARHRRPHGPKLRAGRAGPCPAYHQDLSHRRRPAPRGDDGPVVNWSVRDISKRRVSVLRITPEDRRDGPVIIKTNLNHSGITETRGVPVDQREGNRKRKAHISWRSARRLPHRRHPVLDSIARMPRWVWEDDSLVVERFLPERDGDLYCLRGWMFFGSRS